jgi:hypothetical protein
MLRIIGRFRRPPSKSTPPPAESPLSGQANSGAESATRPGGEARPTRRRRAGELIGKFGAATIAAGRLAYEVLSGNWPD